MAARNISYYAVEEHPSAFIPMFSNEERLLHKRGALKGIYVKVRKNPNWFGKSEEQKQREELDALGRMVGRQQERIISTRRNNRLREEEVTDPDILNFRKAIAEHERQIKEKREDKEKREREEFIASQPVIEKIDASIGIDKLIAARKKKEKREAEDFRRDWLGGAEALAEREAPEDEFRKRWLGEQSNPRRKHVLLFGIAAIALIKIVSGRMK